LQIYIVELEPPEKRRSKCRGTKERHLTEAAVMLACAMHLFRTQPELQKIELHPGGQHGKRFDISGWLSAHGFVMEESYGTTSYCGRYGSGENCVVVSSVPGRGHVVAAYAKGSIVAECKGGIVNTRHSGQTSRLRKDLCEAAGLLM